MTLFRILTVVSVILLSICILTGCGDEDRDYLPEYVPPSEERAEAPDDVIFTPGGSAYLANGNSTNGSNHWKPIETAEIELRRGFEKIYIGYRGDIVTVAGETRNNIFHLRKQGGLHDTFPEDVQLYLSGNSSGMKLFQQGGGGLPGTVVKILVIEIPEDMLPGIYEFEIGIETKGKDYGTVPCTVEIVNDHTEAAISYFVTSIEKSMVHVRGTGEFGSVSSYGIVVGDGNQVLTVFNYELFTPGSNPLEVETASGEQYEAMIKAIDPQTSATLLMLENADLTPCTTVNASGISPEDDAFVQGWDHHGKFRQGPIIIRTITNLHIDSHFDTNLFEGGGAYGGGPGAPITDKNGNVFGIVGTIYNKFVVVLGHPGMMPNGVTIENALKLLAPDTVNQVPLQSPVLISRTAKRIDVTVTPTEQFTETVLPLFETLGQPLETDSEQDFPRWFYPIEDDSTLLTMCFIYPQEIKNTHGELIAEAKWVSLHWNRSDEKPNRLFYGTEPYETEGICEFTGNTSALENLLK